MLKCIATFLVIGVVFVSSQNWLTNSHVLEFEEYFTKVMQETFEELERREWCNLKLDNVYQTVSDSLYNFVVNGTVVYSNGFLISIQKINLVNIQSLLTTNANGTTNALVRGRINLNDVLVGFNVEVTLNNDGVITVHKSTASYNYTLIQFEVLIQKDLNTEEMTVSSSMITLSAVTGTRMIFLPANNITEALSRRWIAANGWSGVGRWGPDHITPIVQNITSTHLPFPGICIGCYA